MREEGGREEEGKGRRGGGERREGRGGGREGGSLLVYRRVGGLKADYRFIHLID